MTFGSGYDAWLEQPYREAAERSHWEEQAVEWYANVKGIDVEDVDVETAIYEWEDAQQSAAEDHAADMAEMRRDEGMDDDWGWE